MLERTTEKCHPDSLGCVVSSCSWGKHEALSTESSLRFCNEDQLKSNKKYGDSVYAILALVRTNQKKKKKKKGLDTHSWKMYNNQEGYQNRMILWKIEEQNGKRKQP
jgi:hypothetical protein